MEIEKSDKILRKELLTQIRELEQALAIRKQMLESLSTHDEKAVETRPKTKPWLLRDYLEQNQLGEGIQISEVPSALRQMGFVSKESSPTTNWLRQPKPNLDFFVVQKGRVWLRKDLNLRDEEVGHCEEPSVPISNEGSV